jgi:phosphoglycolate phosphatase-like HAD superfamily hydrolase
MKRGMKNKIKLLLLDFDGTLADTKKRWFSSILKVLKREKLYCPECETKVIIHFGKKIKDVLEMTDVSTKEISRIRNEIYKEFLKKKSKALNLETLKGIKCRKFILSNSPRRVIKKVLGKQIKIFDKVYSEETFDNKPELIRKLKKKMKFSSEEVAYVGDRAGDVLTARKAGCLSIIIASRFAWNTRDEIIEASPDIVLGRLEDLKKLF